MDRLLELQRIDSGLDRRTSRRAEIEAGGEVGVARSNLEEAERRLGELRLSLDSLERAQRRLESDVDAFTSKAADEEKRLYDGSVVNTKELEAVQAEIRSARERKARTEDDLLERMERREELEADIQVAQTEANAAREGLEAVGADAARELEVIANSLATRVAERDGIVAEIDEELLELYDDLRRQKKGIGVAALEDGVCQGCHQKLSPLELDRLKKVEGIKRCNYCRRILVSV